MAASNSEKNPTTNCGDAACLRPTKSTTAGTGGPQPRSVRSRPRTGGPTAAEIPPPRRILTPLLEDARRPTGAMKMKERLQERVESILEVALSCAIGLLVTAFISFFTGRCSSVGTSFLAAGILIEFACGFLYLCSRREDMRAELAVILLSEVERDAGVVSSATESRVRRSRRVPNDDGRDYAGSTGDAGDVWYDNIV